jgi:UDP-N-acetylglucosamine--N-acetylmuramyl-(pentapeptide) pyrophosphoryl-undecaprenol N-acetylglucosamine transferase
MSDVLACADLVVSRAGANSVWECATLGKPMILIPLEKGASRGDQIENADYFASRGAAIVLSGEKASAQGLLTAASSLASDPGRARLMSERAASIAGDRPSVGVAERLLRAFAGEDL